MKIKKIILSALLITAMTSLTSYAEDVKTPSNETPSMVEYNVVNVSNVSSPTLVAPVVEDTKPNTKAKPTKRLDLSAVVFDPNADFSLQAKEENREMTRMEEAEYNIHEALHGSVTETSKLSKSGLLNKYLTVKPKGGILESVTQYTGYRGSFSGVWLGDDYKNSLYGVETLSTTFEGKFKDKRTSFRSMFFFQPGKEGHTFFNDFWGDQYLQYAWSKDKNDQLLVGYARNTFDVEGSMSPWVLPLINRSQIAKTYNNVSSLQVKAQGVHKLYDYSAAISSAGRYFMDWFPGPEFTGSFAVKPLGLTNGKYGNLRLGGGLNAGNAEARYTVGTAYVDYEYKRWNATLEYGSAEGSNGSIGYTANHSEGFNGTLAYRVTPRTQVLVRYDQFDPNKDKRNDIRREYTVGLNYFLKEQALRLLVNYTVYSIETGVFGSRVMVGTQVLL